jgi:hypothetical protein
MRVTPPFRTLSSRRERYIITSRGKEACRIESVYSVCRCDYLDSLPLNRRDLTLLLDPLSQSMLASVTAPHASSKHKTIELYNPSQAMEFKSIGILAFRWSFDWEESVHRQISLSSGLSHLFGVQTYFRVEERRVLSYSETRPSCPCRDHERSSREIEDLDDSDSRLQPQPVRFWLTIV